MPILPVDNASQPVRVRIGIVLFAEQHIVRPKVAVAQDRRVSESRVRAHPHIVHAFCIEQVCALVQCRIVTARLFG
jgi:hypothetical protein